VRQSSKDQPRALIGRGKGPSCRRRPTERAAVGSIDEDARQEDSRGLRDDRSALIGQYGKQANATLNDFGMRPPKVAQAPTVKVKAEAVDKRAATRVARHTMGKVQRKAVTGASVSTPAPVAPAAPVAAPVAPTAPETPTTPTAR
jgi:hypothetical protein